MNREREERLLRPVEARQGDPSGRLALALSAGLHGALLALLLGELVQLGDPLPLNQAIPVTVVYEDQSDPEVEVAEAIGPEPEVAEEILHKPEPEPQPETVEETPPEPEPEPQPETVEETPPEPEPEPQPETVEETPARARAGTGAGDRRGDPARARAGTAAGDRRGDPARARAGTAARDRRGDPRPSPSRNRSPRTVEEIPPAPEPEPEPEIVEETPPAPLPELVLLPTPPLPARKPESAGLLPTSDPEPPVAPEPAETVLAEPAAPKEPAPLSEAVEPAYRHQGESGAVTPEQFLANLTALADEDLQAERNPALWEVVRAVRKQMRQCWMLDPRNPPSARMTVDMKLKFDRDGRVLTAEIKEIGRMVNDQAYQTFVVDARAALMSCSPFELPPETYGIWRSFTMRFVPINRL